jgi:hypothetical protein
MPAAIRRGDRSRSLRPKQSKPTLSMTMVFAELKPQMEQLPPAEMLKALAFLKSRLRAETDANRTELSRLHAEMDAGRKVRWEDLKRQLGLS